MRNLRKIIHFLAKPRSFKVVYKITNEEYRVKQIFNSTAFPSYGFLYVGISLYGMPGMGTILLPDQLYMLELI